MARRGGDREGRERRGKGPVTRDAFIYLDPKPPKDEFAQCATCMMFVEADGRCTIHGPKVEINGGKSCAFYVHGKPMPKGTETMASVTPTESGLVEREVRCENCRYFEAGESGCGLFDRLNGKFPDIFDLDPKVDPKGCCNAQEPPGKRDRGKPAPGHRRKALYDHPRSGSAR